MWVQLGLFLMLSHYLNIELSLSGKSASSEVQTADIGALWKLVLGFYVLR